MVKRLLLIDDDRDDADIFQEALSETDSTAAFSFIEDGRQAVQKLAERGAQAPHIIFLDVNMPAISGWECLKQLKKHDALKDVPVVMYSTSSHQREQAMAKELGAATFMTKPNNFNELKKKIGELMNEFIR